jgi:membrane protein YqaA with SNARE-associated domain
MRIFSWTYKKALEWAAHHHAPRYLALLSFTESSVFPVPPDVMLAPMVLAQRQRAWYFAALTTITSVLGGLLGYAIGLFLFEEVGQPLITMYHAQDNFQRVQDWFSDYGIWVVFLAGFTPIPYKLFTVTSGVLALAVLPFVFASLVGRGARFFLVAALLYWGGERFSRFLHQRVDQIGWAVLGLVLVALVIARYLN